MQYLIFIALVSVTSSDPTFLLTSIPPFETKEQCINFLDINEQSMIQSLLSNKEPGSKAKIVCMTKNDIDNTLKTLDSKDV